MCVYCNSFMNNAHKLSAKADFINDNRSVIIIIIIIIMNIN